MVANMMYRTIELTLPIASIATRQRALKKIHFLTEPLARGFVLDVVTKYLSILDAKHDINCETLHWMTSVARNIA